VPNDTDLANQLKLATDKGMIVAGVDSGSAASKAGLRPLDVIFDIEDIELTDDAQMCDILKSHSEGQALKVSVVRGTQLYSGEINGAQLAFDRDLGAKPAPTTQPQPQPQPQATSQPKPSGNAYPAPTLSGTCGSTLTPGDFVLDIGFPQGLKTDEAYDIRARPSWELGKPGWRGVGVTRDTHYVISGRGTGYNYSFINDPGECGTYYLTVAVIRTVNGQFAAQLSPESNQCALQW
jgi:hypothetical protein